MGNYIRIFNKFKKYKFFKKLKTHNNVAKHKQILHILKKQILIEKNENFIPIKKYRIVLGRKSN